MEKPPALHGLFFKARPSRRDHVAAYVIRRFTILRGRRPNFEIQEARFCGIAAMHATASTTCGALSADEPDDYVLATGRSHSVRYLLECAFAQVGIEIRWSGEGTDERGVDVKRDPLLVRIDPRYFRPTEVDLLVGDASKAKARLGWTAKTTFEETVAEMAYEDVRSLKVGQWRIFG